MSEDKQLKQDNIKSYKSLNRSISNPGITAPTSGTTLNATKSSLSTLFVSASGEFSAAHSFSEWMSNKVKRARAQADSLSTALQETTLDGKISKFHELAGESGSSIALTNVSGWVLYPNDLLIDCLNYPNVVEYDPQDVETVLEDMSNGGISINQITLSDIDESTTSTALSGVFTNAVVRVEDVLEAQQTEDEAADQTTSMTIPLFISARLTGSSDQAYAYIDDVVSSISESAITAESLSAMADTILEDFSTNEEDQPFTSRFIDSVTTKGLTASGLALSLIDQVRPSLQDGGLSVTEKIKSVLHACGLTPDSADASNVLEPVSSSLSGMTGASPVALFGEKIVSNFDDINWSSIGSALSSTWNAIAKSASQCFSGCANWIGKQMHKIKASTVAADDIYVIDKKQDPVINNLGWTFRIQGIPKKWFDALSETEYTVFCAPSAKIYLVGVHEDIAGFDVYHVDGIIKFSPVETVDTGFAPFTEAALQYNAAPEWVFSDSYANDVATKYGNLCTDVQDPTSDNAAYDAINLSKNDLWIWGTLLSVWAMTPVLQQAYFIDPGNIYDRKQAGAECARLFKQAIINDNWISRNIVNLFYLFDDRQNYINDIWSAPANPTNAQLANEACYFMGHSLNDGPYIANYSSSWSACSDNHSKWEAKGWLLTVVETLLRYVSGDWEYVNDISYVFVDMVDELMIPYVPYYHSNSSLDGRYAIKTDSQNAQSYAKLLAGFAITGAALIVGSVLLRRKLTARKRAYALQAQINHDNYHVEEALGNSPDDIKHYFGMAGITNVSVDSETGIPNNQKQINKMLGYWSKVNKKRNRKLNRLTKLIGLRASADLANNVYERVSGDNSSAEMNFDIILDKICGKV